MVTLFDESWLNVGGIGRFSQEIYSRNSQWIGLSRDRPTSPESPLSLAWQLRKYGPGDRIFVPGYIPPLRSRVAAAITIHDLMYLGGGASASRTRSAYFGVIKELVARNRVSICTVSEYSRAKIADWIGDDWPIKVVGNGVSLPLRRRVPPTPSSPDVLLVSSERPNKNLVRQLRAASRAVARSGRITLVLPSAPSQSLRSEIARLGSKVWVLVAISDSELAARYSEASVLSCASLDEGFGLPALEAMAAGCPVVSSNHGGLSEVVGDAGLIVDPRSISSIRDGLEAVLRGTVDVDLLTTRATARAARFDWDQVSQRVNALLDQLPQD